MSGGIDYRIDVTDNGRVFVRFEQLPKAVQKKLKVKITQLTSELLGRVKAAEPHDTGRLQSLTRSFVDEKQGWVRGRVRVLRTKDKNTAAAAGALEYGAHRRFQVRAHSRRGRGAARKVQVSAYNRTAHITAMKFLRGPAAALLPRARAELNATIEAAIEELN